MAFTIYIAASYKHLHGVRLLGRELRNLGFEISDWTEKASPPEGLTPTQRRAWMDTDHGGEVYKFCENACRDADLLIYYGASGQDAGVEVGLARAWAIPIFGIRGPLEAPGLMLYGAGSVWVEDVDSAVDIFRALAERLEHGLVDSPYQEIVDKLVSRYDVK